MTAVAVSVTRARARVVRPVLVRLGTSVLVLWGAVTVAFAGLHLTPGDVVDLLIGANTVTPEVRERIIADYGLDRPLLAQYVTYLGRVLHGDLGQSYQLHQSVASAIGEQVGSSVQLMLSSFALAVVVSVTVAVLTAGRRWVRAVFSGIELVGISIPSFWAGILLLTVFSFGLRLFPAVGGEGLEGLVLPSVAMAIPVVATLTQVLREGLELTLEEPFVLTARSRGMSDLGVRLRHALRHALLPTVTLAGWMVSFLFGGAVIIESVFSRQGIGRLTLTAVANKDLPVVMGVVLIAALLYVVINIVLDLLYLAIDPRLQGA